MDIFCYDKKKKKKNVTLMFLALINALSNYFWVKLGTAYMGQCISVTNIAFWMTTTIPPPVVYILNWSNNTMSVMLCTGVAFVKKNSCLVARMGLFDTAGLHLLTFRILEPYPSKDIELDLSHVMSH